MTLPQFRDMLVSVGIPVHHYEAQQQTGRYIVWAEYDTDTFTSDNKRIKIVNRIRVALFTPVEFDEAVDALEAALEKAGVSVDGPKTAYIRDTQQIVKQYECEVVV